MLFRRLPPPRDPASGRASFRIRMAGVRYRRPTAHSSCCSAKTANQATHGWSVREDAHDIGATSDLLVETLQGVVWTRSSVGRQGSWRRPGYRVQPRPVERPPEGTGPGVDRSPYRVGRVPHRGRVAGRWCGPWWPPMVGLFWVPSEQVMKWVRHRCQRLRRRLRRWRRGVPDERPRPPARPR